ncbi:hypothetical protein MRB53_013401 [Persea americana]|uniref:Uncharacterized protein n=1 Tax=Persea americana TaxID=3435 RepID=A0ACC2K7V7_PERAE|nr:hypothetical protein MRB53_013401 [Persea americana]
MLQLGTPVSVAEVLSILQTEPLSFAPSSSHLSTVHIQKLSALIHQQGPAGLESQRAQVQSQTHPPPPQSYASLLSQPPISLPKSMPSTSWIDGKPSVKIPKDMISSSQESFSFAAIGRFEGKRPSLE